jgi:hypothetical protein
MPKREREREIERKGDRSRNIFYFFFFFESDIPAGEGTFCAITFKIGRAYNLAFFAPALPSSAHISS